MEVLPYIDKEHDKKGQVTCMFNQIAGKYDFLNHFLSFHIDKLWRKKAIEFLKKSSPQRILDLATGTGDFAIESLRVKPQHVIGIDISEEMLRFGTEKINKKKLADKINFVFGDAENLPFENDSFDAVISGFGVRNFSNVPEGLKEAGRVLKKGGQLVILEFSTPKGKYFGKLFSFYFTKILPAVGGFVSGDKSAYIYLPESVHAFPSGNEFLRLVEEAGFVKCKLKPLTFGIATIYSGFKA